MAATLVQQLYSQNHWAGMDGVQTIWNFTFAGGYIFKEHVKAYYLDANGTPVIVPVTPTMFTGPYQLRVIPAVPASATRFVIYRDTPKDLPLVDFEGGSVMSEVNLDRAAKQAIFVAAEAIDSAWGANIGLDEFGFKALKRVTYIGASTMTEADNGKSHYKTDATSVTVPNTLPVEFLSTIVNNSTSPMSVTFSDAVAVLQGAGDPTGKASWTLSAKSLLSITKVADGLWFIAGAAT